MYAHARSYHLKAIPLQKRDTVLYSNALKLVETLQAYYLTRRIAYLFIE